MLQLLYILQQLVVFNTLQRLYLIFSAW